MYKYQKYMHYFNKWMENREHGLWIADYLKKQGSPSVSVYGCGILGRHLIWELNNKNYPVMWIMDKSDSHEQYEVNGLKDINTVKKVNLVIVTAMADYEDVEMFICAHDVGRPISLEELINIIHGGVK